MITRRSVLAGAAVLAVALAGCSSTTEDVGGPFSSGPPAVPASGSSSASPSGTPSASISTSYSGPGLRIVCSTVDDSTPDAAAMRSALLSRLAADGVTAASVEVTGTTATMTVPSSPAVDASRLCRSARLTFRPLLVPAVPVTCTTSGAARCAPVLDRLPRDAAAVAKLSSTGLVLLAKKLAGVDCATQAGLAIPDNRAQLVCGSNGSTRTAYLTGPAVVAGDDVVAARPVAPGAGGSPQWTVSISLNAAGRSAWARWTAAHNTGNSASADPAACAPYATACANFVAFVYDGAALSVPATVQPIVGVDTTVSGSFTATSARALSSALAAAPLPVSMKVDSVTRVN